MATRQDAPLNGENRTSRDIRRDIERNRREIDATARELGDELAPARVARQVWGDLEPRLEQSKDALVEGLRSHPLPAALVALGVGWLIVELASGDSVSTDDVREAQVPTLPADWVDQGRHGVRKAWDSVAHASRSRPFALGTLALGAGILTGIALPDRRAASRPM